jgi:signal transduction histidine kinase
VTITDRRFGTVAEVTNGHRHRARTGTLVAVDAVVAVVAIGVSWALLSATRADWPVDARTPDGVAGALVIVMNAPIAFRRRACRVALAVALCGGLIYAARSYPPTFAPAVPLIIYLAATRLDDRRSRLVLIVAAVVSWITATVAAGPTDPASLLVVAGAWLLGHYVRTRRLLVAELEQRALDLEREREERARRAVAEERLRIARELHDVLAHTMSVVAVQAGTGRLIGPEHPAEALKALTAVEETTRSAMRELRELLTVLRTDDDRGSVVTPAPGLGDLPALVTQVAEAGLVVDLRVEGEPRAVPAGVGVAAYRIAQEALTNVIKHVGPAHVSLLVRYSDQDLTVEVCDDGHTGRSKVVTGGQGLVGMRERAAVHGGELIAEPTSGGGFRVKARLPLGTVES